MLQRKSPSFLDLDVVSLWTEPVPMQAGLEPGDPNPPTVTAASSTPLKPAPPPTPAADRAFSTTTKAELVRDPDNSPRPGKRPRLNPPPMTAAAALVDVQRAKEKGQDTPSAQTSRNPAARALEALRGSGSRPTSSAGGENGTAAAESAAPRVSEPPAGVANIRETPNTEAMQVDATAQTSPASLSSIGTLESTIPAPPTMPSNVESPTPMDVGPEEGEGKSRAESTSPDDGLKAFSYPGPNLQPQPSDHRRGMSLPNSAARQGGSRSPPNKKHRCPYCSTEFTRHHNLKSHLLTHSQEKPYVCSTCQSRFRRLHDLKRHAKLHTGERPHICDQCGRKFARGDALARHNKGPGGCAGRRASLGSFGGDDDLDGGDEAMDEEEGAGPPRPRVPSIRRHDAPADGSRPEGSRQGSFAGRQPSTYPPIQGRPPGGIASGAFPPRPTPAGAGSPPGSGAPGGSNQFPASSPSANLQPPGQGAPVFPPAATAESPKPLSPGSIPAAQSPHAQAGPYRNRASSLTNQFQPQPFGRGSAQRTPPVGAVNLSPGGPQLPPPPGLNPPDSRFTLPSQAGPTHPPTQPSGPPTHMGGGGPLSSHSNSLSSHTHSGPGSGENASAMFVSNNDRLWAYVKSLEQRVNGLQEEVNSLRQLLAAAGPARPT